MFQKLTFLAYGSLMSPESAIKTCPSADNFRVVEVKGYRRLFNVVHVRGVKDGDITPDKMTISACSAEKHAAYKMLCIAFDIDLKDFRKLYERRREYNFTEAKYWDPSIEQKGKGLICTPFLEWQMRAKAFPVDKLYYDCVGRFYDGVIWRDDIFPSAPYVSECLVAAENHSKKLKDDFLDTTFLSNGKTSLREYLKR